MTPQRCVPAAVCLLAAAALHAAEIYVATDGSDEAPGTRERPMQTIQKALDRVRPGDTVVVRGGTYRETVRLTASGTAEAPVRIMAMPGETVVLSGTEPINADWTVHKGRIFKAKVEACPRALFVDGRLMTEARWPDMPFEQRWDKTVWAAADKGTQYGTMVDADLAAAGLDFTGAVATLNIGSWQTFRRIVRRHGAGADRFTYDTDPKSRLADEKPHRPGFDRYFLAGKLEALDSPAEWFFDRTSATLYLWTPDGKSPETHRVEGKVRGYAFEAKGVGHVHLSGLGFFAATFKFEDATSCRVENVHLEFPHGVYDPFGPPQGLKRAPEEPNDWPSRRWFGETSVVTPTYLGGRNNTLAGCSIACANGSAVVLAGGKNTIENCLIHDIDWYGLDTGLGVDMLGTRDSRIRYSTVFNVGSSEGVRLTNQGPTVVEFNYLHHGGLVQSDGALVQCGTPGIRGTVLRHNWVHDHNAFNWGGSGLRGDDRTRGLLIHHNVAWNCRYKGIITKGDENRIYNNTCLNNPERDILVPRGRLPGKTRELEVQNARSETVNNSARVISGRYTWERKEEPPLGKVAANFSGDDPRLVDPGRFDFRPRAGSPLIDAGQVIPGITDGFRGKAPDIGAYEYGAERWVPGYRNALWILPDGAGKRGQVRVLLTMPTLAPVTVSVSGGASGGAVSPARLTFTPADWMRPQTPTVTGDAPAVRFVIEDLGLDATVKPGDLDPLGGVRLPFRSMP